MRFRKLDLNAFGSFSGVSLDLAGGKGGGLHIIYGANEAGKSTALRAISALLFGIPERTVDDHTHGTKLMRVGAVLEDAHGRLHTFVRRKKRKDALRGANDEPVSEASLASLFGGLSQGMFESMFGLDHLRLAQAGEALLAGEGDLGESLFEAKMGGEGTRRVLAKLEEEADALFKPAGRTKPLINVALEAHRQAVKHWREAVQRPEAWHEQQSGLERALAEKASLERERRTCREELARLRRVVGALPWATRRAEGRAELEKLGESPGSVVELFNSCQHLSEQLRQIERDWARTQHTLVKLEVERAQLLLEAGGGTAAFDALAIAEELAVLRSERTHSERLIGEIGVLRRDAEDLSRRLPFSIDASNTEHLRLDVERDARIRRLGREAQELSRLQQEAERQLQEERVELGLAAAERAPSRDPLAVQALAGTVRSLSQKVFLETQRAGQQSAVAGAKAELLELVRLLAPWTGDFEQLLALNLPGSEELELYAHGFQKSDQEKQRIEARSLELRSAGIDCARRRESIQGAFQVPSEQSLQQARSRRDALWEGLNLAIAADPPADRSVLLTLTPAFERALMEADEQSDRLWREAQRVVDLANAQAEEGAVLREQAALEQDLLRWQKKRDELDAAFASLCAHFGHEDVSFAALSAWMRRTELARAAAKALKHSERELSVCETDYAHVRQRLIEVFGKCGAEAPEAASSLAECWERAQLVVEAQSQVVEEQRRVSQELARREIRVADAQARLADAEGKLAGWQADWQAATMGLTASGKGLVEEVLATLSQLTLVLQKSDEVQAKQQQLSEMQVRLAAFAAKIHGVVVSQARDLAELAPLAAAEVLVQRARTREVATQKLLQANARLNEQRSEMETLEFEQQRVTQEIARICEVAGVGDAHALRDAGVLEQSRQALRASLAECDKELLELGARHGLGLEELLAETLTIEPGTLQLKHDELETTLEELEARYLVVDREIAGLERGLAHFGTTNGAEAAQTVQAKAAAVRQLAIRYQEFRMAALLLRREIEEYRVAHQDPLLRRAGQLFSKMTLGAYSSLRVGVEERVIRCVRSDELEQEVRALSEGTRYQLYLALRLASIEAYLAENEPMPLVFDDLLLHFDDERARVTLEVLAELSRVTQILFFTHHEHLLTLARRALKPALRIEHRLSGPALHGQQELFGQARVS